MSVLRHFVDNRSSPPTDWEPHGLIVQEELWFSYNAAKTRVGRKGDDMDPLEWESTNLWEDLYHHYLLRGYCNNSQIPPHNTSGARCDIVTRYFNAGARKTMLFTEVKRANRVEDTTGIADAETQVLKYCSAYLKANGSSKEVYACTAIGHLIRCFLVRYPDGVDRDAESAAPALFDLHDLLQSRANGTPDPRPVNVKESTINSYKDAGKNDHANDIRKCFKEIRKLGPPPFASSSRPHSSSSSKSLPRPASAVSLDSVPAYGSSMSGVSGNSARRSASQTRSESPRGHRSTGSVSSRDGRPGVQDAGAGAETPEQHSSPGSAADLPLRGRRGIDPNSRNSESPRARSSSKGKNYRERTPPPPRDESTRP